MSDYFIIFNTQDYLIWIKKLAHNQVQLLSTIEYNFDDSFQFNYAMQLKYFQPDLL